MVTINIGRKEAVFFGAIILVFLIVGLGVAYGGNNPSVMGHSAGELNVSLVCTQASINNKLQVEILSGISSAVVAVDIPASGDQELKWGLKCMNGYQKMGCHIQNRGNAGSIGSTYDVDLNPSADSCLSDNDEKAMELSAISITCCKLG